MHSRNDSKESSAGSDLLRSVLSSNKEFAAISIYRASPEGKVSKVSLEFTPYRDSLFFDKIDADSVMKKLEGSAQKSAQVIAKGRKESPTKELPVTAEAATTLEKTDAMFIPRSRESALTVRRLILGSAKFQLIKNSAQQENPPAGPARNPIHFGKNRAIVATLETNTKKTNLSLARALQKSLDSDYFYGGEEQTIFSARKMIDRNWSSVAQLKHVNAYCAGKNTKIAGKIIRDFSKSKDLIAHACNYIFEGETAPQVFEQRE
jgi:hypothetical protein